MPQSAATGGLISQGEDKAGCYPVAEASRSSEPRGAGPNHPRPAIHTRIGNGVLCFLRGTNSDEGRVAVPSLKLKVFLFLAC